MILYAAARERLGRDRILTDHDCVGVEQDEDGVTIAFKAFSSGQARAPVRASVAIGCDGINSVVRKQFYPNDRVAFAGINTWRGVTRRKPILTGRSYLRIGSILTGKIVVYPIVDDIDGEGNQLINWMAEIKRDTFDQNDWNKPGDARRFPPDLPGLALRLARRGRADPQRRPDPRISDGRQGSGRPLDLRPRHARGRCRASDVSARLERRRAGRDRRARAGRLPAGERRRARGACAPTRRRAARPPPRWCAPTASIRRISSTSRSRSWSATSRSRISTTTSPRTSCGRCRRTTSGSPGFRLSDVAAG